MDHPLDPCSHPGRGPSSRTWLRRMVPWLPALTIVAGLFALSSVPGPALPAKPFWNGDLAAHALLYAFLGAAVAFPLRRLEIVSGLRQLVALSAVLAALHGVVDEWHQFYTPGRSPSALDAAADALGGLVGAWIYARRLRRKAPRSA